MSFRGKGKKRLRSRFAFQRVTAAHPVTRDNQAPREEWLIIEWPEGRNAPIDYWISNLPADTKPERLARLARLRWMIELDYRQLKGELGLDHYEGRSYLGWYHYTALVTTAHAFLTLERQNAKAQRRASHSPDAPPPRAHLRLLGRTLPRLPPADKPRQPPTTHPTTK